MARLPTVCAHALKTARNPIFYPLDGRFRRGWRLQPFQWAGLERGHYGILAWSAAPGRRDPSVLPQARPQISSRRQQGNDAEGMRDVTRPMTCCATRKSARPDNLAAGVHRMAASSRRPAGTRFRVPPGGARRRGAIQSSSRPCSAGGGMRRRTSRARRRPPCGDRGGPEDALHGATRDISLRSMRMDDQGRPQMSTRT